jgi:protein-S-isoprenylcysteine O-methyltransferase Ste14
MATELRSLAAAMLAHQVVGTRPLDPVDSHQRARFMLAGLIFGVYYRGSSYIFSGFAEAGTSALTSEPTTALVTAGPYAVSRNPAMLIVWVFHVACALAFNSWWPLLVAAPLTYAYLTLITVPNEEEALEKQFGRRYREYKQRTPRYLIPHSCDARPPACCLPACHLPPAACLHAVFPGHRQHAILQRQFLSFSFDCSCCTIGSTRAHPVPCAVLF